MWNPQSENTYEGYGVSCTTVAPDGSILISIYANDGTTHNPVWGSLIYYYDGTTIRRFSGFTEIAGGYSSLQYNNKGEFCTSGGFGLIIEGTSLTTDSVSRFVFAPDGSIWTLSSTSTTSTLKRYGEPTYSLGVESEEAASVPQPVKLNANYPNPFNPSTTISFNLQEPGMTKLVIYNIMGQEVRYLLNYNMEAGNHNVVWNGKDDKGKAVSSGVYIIRLEAGKNIAMGKMLLMK